MKESKAELKATHCLMCGSGSLESYFLDQIRFYKKSYKRCYWLCTDCEYLFLDPGLRMPPEQEKARYEKHDNDAEGEKRVKYRQFLGQLWLPLFDRINTSSRGLDFGCGPYPELVHWMREMGFEAEGYDPYFAREESLLSLESYDYVTCTEVVEHMYEPGIELENLIDLLKPKGWLGLMTQPHLNDKSHFSGWKYRMDPTHVGFFTEKTFHLFAERNCLNLQQVNSCSFLLQKN